VLEIYSFFSTFFPKIQSGVIYSAEYNSWRKLKGYTSLTRISSDATAVETSIKFDRVTEELVGFVPKLVPETGLPSHRNFPTDYPSQMIGYFQDESIHKADNIVLILATPFEHNAESFVLGYFPTDNSYKSEAAHNRNAFIDEVLANEECVVVCSTTDADPKEKSAAKLHSKFGNVEIHHGIQLVYSPFIERLVTFDIKHVVNSMKMRLFDTTRIRRIQNEPILLADIQLLEKEFSKDVHGLNHSDISNIDKTLDKMDKQSTARICSWQVIDKLMDLGAFGTRFFLKIMRQLLEVFEDPTLNDRSRLNKAAYVVFTLRTWRQQIKVEGGNVEDFITHSA
jgi:hypothetical protein